MSGARRARASSPFLAAPLPSSHDSPPNSLPCPSPCLQSGDRLADSPVPSPTCLFPCLRRFSQPANQPGPQGQTVVRDRLPSPSTHPVLPTTPFPPSVPSPCLRRPALSHVPYPLFRTIPRQHAPQISLFSCPTKSLFRPLTPFPPCSIPFLVPT